MHRVGAPPLAVSAFSRGGFGGVGAHSYFRRGKGPLSAQYVAAILSESISSIPASSDYFAEPNMPIDLYYIPGSAPCRAVLLAAKAVGVELNLKLTDLMAGEHLKPEFIKLNPQHCVPTIDDNGFALWESRAICTYLANQYGGNESLYPKDPKKRAVVDSRLYFDQGTLYQRFAEYYYPVMFGGAPFDEAKLKKLEEAYEYLDKFLDGQDWAAGSEMTLADISLASSVSTAEVVGFDLSKYANVTSWLKKCKSTLPGYGDVNQPGVEMFKEMFDKLTKK